jgi:hypothetical protein
MMALHARPFFVVLQYPANLLLERFHGSVDVTFLHPSLLPRAQHGFLL